MKRCCMILFMVSVMAYLDSCKKDEGPLNKLTYQTTFLGMTNILKGDSDMVIIGNVEYCMEATLEKNAKLSVLITNFSLKDSVNHSLPIWGFTNPQLWQFTKYDFVSNKQTFQVMTGEPNLKIVFIGKAGRARIDFFENSDTITRSKNIFWGL